MAGHIVDAVVFTIDVRPCSKTDPTAQLDPRVNVNMDSAPSPRLPLRIGCPVWNCDAWGGVVYPVKTPRRKWLHWYSRMFNTSEGNSSFYATPTPEQARRWANEAADGFQFCMKFPREITHERELLHAETATRQFTEVLYVLAESNRLGPSFLQLSPRFAADRIRVLESYLDVFPRELPLAVEVRHASWFDASGNEHALDSLLASRGIDRVLFDSRPLYQSPAEDPIERESQRRKPKSPFRTTVTGKRPMIRLVGRNRVELADPYIDEWAPIIAEWIRDGLEPIVFTHAPDDALAPALARRFWDCLRKHLPLNQPELPLPPQQPKQLGLFEL